MIKSSGGFLLAGVLTIPFTGTANAGPEACEKRSNNNPQKLLECVTLDNVRAHQEAFQYAADASGGTREASSLGYELSGQYVADQLAAAGYDVTIQPFDYPFFEETEPGEFEQIAPDSQTYGYFIDFAPMSYSGSGDVTGTAMGVDLIIPPAPVANTSTSGCEPEDFDGFVSGRIAVLQRGSCSFAQKALNAEAAGAIGVVIFNEGQPGRTGAFLGTLGGPESNIPVVGTSYAIGEDLATNGAVTRLFVNAVSETRNTFNVIADGTSGRANNVVMVGAHLDSVAEGPGVQDNGSGSAAILETAIQMKKVNARNQVRFAWWGAEEAGLLGSEHYVANLTDDELDNIALYLNFDMIGSPNYFFGIYDGDGSDFGLVGPPGSDAIEKTFEDYYAAIDEPSQASAFSGRSDYAAFIAVGIPSGGLFTGAEGIKTPEEANLYGGVSGEQYDPCYHLACDTFANVSNKALEVNSDAVAFATLKYVMSTETINEFRGKGNFKERKLEMDAEMGKFEYRGNRLQR